jgi:hypothetical protein
MKAISWVVVMAYLVAALVLLDRGAPWGLGKWQYALVLIGIGGALGAAMAAVTQRVDRRRRALHP